jgi:hypothetical protein
VGSWGRHGGADLRGDGAAPQITALAKTFYDGRAPTKKKVIEILSRLDLHNDGAVSLEEFLAAAHVLKTAFGGAEEPSSFGARESE